MIYVCSPLRGNVEKNIENAKMYCRFVYERGNTPIAPHLLFTQFMNDDSETERIDAMHMDMQILDRCEELWVFGLDGISEGMAHEIERAGRNGMPVKYFMTTEDMNSYAGE